MEPTATNLWPLQNRRSGKHRSAPSPPRTTKVQYYRQHFYCGSTGMPKTAMTTIGPSRWTARSTYYQTERDRSKSSEDRYRNTTAGEHRSARAATNKPKDRLIPAQPQSRSTRSHEPQEWIFPTASVPVSHLQSREASVPTK
jgi:hypothetical protein